ncbi:MAG: hypothetical protein M3P27_08935, partial [Acidobacteriota bacterium]|nr:hypothetical protein [Acidobacteriota bacterium]
MRLGRGIACVLIAALAANPAANGGTNSAPQARAKALPSAPRRAQRSAADEAARALFLRSDVEQARALAARVVRSDALRDKQDKADARALFVAMEAAALAADTAPLLDAALRLCELRHPDWRVNDARLNDARVNIAAARILEQAEQAANTSAFRAAVPRIEKLLAAGSPQAPYLRAALLAAAEDGVPGLDPAALARAAAIQHVSLRLTAGSHRRLLKFLAGAAPWRLTLLPPPASAVATAVVPDVAVRNPAVRNPSVRNPAVRNPGDAALEAEQRYLRAAQKYWQGDAAAIIAELPSPANAAEDLLLGCARARL